GGDIMRVVANLEFRHRTGALITAGLMMLGAAVASAQMVVDGNLVFQNNASNTLAGQGLRAPGAGAPACPGTLSAASPLTTVYTHNLYVDPLLTNAIYPNHNFQPSLGSPAYGHAVVVPNDGFFEQTCYTGAVGPNPQDRWWEGWTTFDSLGCNRTDLHLGPP